MKTSQANARDDAIYRTHSLLPAALAALMLLLCTGSARACGLNVGSGSTVIISSTVTTDCVTVAAGGRIILTNGGMLVLTGSGGNDVSTIDGRIVLEGCDSVLRITDDHTFSGDGYIEGQCNTAMIDDDPNSPCTLTIEDGFTIRGALRICLDLVNNGTVRANDATTAGTRDRLTLDSGTFTGSGLFEVNTANAFLEFDATGVTATGLAADFTVSNGTLDIDDDVCTTGDLSFTGGTIDVAAGKSFKAGGTCP